MRPSLFIAALSIWCSGVVLAAFQSQVPVRVEDRDEAITVTSAGPAMFVPGAECQACHNNLVSPAGEDVSIGASWRASIMAHAGRDPYFQASVRRETIDHPKRASDIEDECAACHMPAARR